MQESANNVIRHDDRGRYELEVDGQVVAFAVFSQQDDRITIPHIETEPAQRRKGYSSLLMDGVIADLRSRGQRVRATCPVARAHIADKAAELLVA